MITNLISIIFRVIIIIIIISVMELGHLLTRSSLTYPEVSSKVYHNSFCPLGSSVSLPWVIYFEAFCLHVVSSFYCIPVICPKLVLFLTPLRTMYSLFITVNRTTCFAWYLHPSMNVIGWELHFPSNHVHDRLHLRFY